MTSPLNPTGAGTTADPSTHRPNRLIVVLTGFVDHVIDALSFLLLVTVIVVVFVGVVARYVFNISFLWTEEAGSWLFVWMTFVGVAAGHRHGRHISSGLLENYLTGRPRQVLAVVNDAIIGFTLMALALGGYEIIVTVGGISIGLQWPSYIKYLIIPAACAFAFLNILLEAAERGWRSFMLASLALAAGVAPAVACYLASASPFPDASASLIMALAFTVGLVIGVPIAHAMLCSVFVAAWATGINFIPGVVHSMVGGVSMFVLVAVPFFLTVGYLMSSSGLARILVDLATSFVGHLRGGLAQANILTSFLMSGVSGSMSADAASVTRIMVPEMTRRGYPAAFACAVTAVGAILPAIFPPSVTLLVYAAIAEQSVAQMFTAGVVPAVVLTLAMMATVAWLARRRNFERAAHRASAALVAKLALQAFPVLLLMFAMLGLLRFGIVTATEVGVIAVVFMLFLSIVYYRSMTSAIFYRNLVESGTQAGIVGFLISVSVPFAWILIAERVPEQLLGGILGDVSNQYLFFFVLIAFVMIAGTVLEVLPILLIVVPLFTPVAEALGLDLVHVGIVVIISAVLGSVSPPVGLLIFICASVAKVPARLIFRESYPLLAVCFVAVFVLAAVPSLTLALWTLTGH